MCDFEELQIDQWRVQTKKTEYTQPANLNCWVDHVHDFNWKHKSHYIAYSFLLHFT